MAEEAFAGVGLIAFREGLEAAILVSLILAVLNRLGRRGFFRVVYASTAGSVAAAALAGWALLKLYGGIPEKELFEGVMSLVAAGLVTTLIVWMARTGSRIAREIESRLSLITTATGVAVFTFIVVSREAVETVLMVAPFLVRDPAGTLAGLLAGVGVAAFVAVAVYAFGVRVSLRRFFLVTSLLLVFVASGLVGYGVHELVEYAEEDMGYNGIMALKAYDLQLPEGHPLSSNSPVGALLEVLVGYSDSMTVGRAAAQFSFLAASLALVLRAYNVRPVKAGEAGGSAGGHSSRVQPGRPLGGGGGPQA